VNIKSKFRIENKIGVQMIGKFEDSVSSKTVERIESIVKSKSSWEMED